MNPIDVVRTYFRAMAAGACAAEDLFELFADDAVYVEPFSGTMCTHSGRAAIEAYLTESWNNSPPDLEVEVERMDVDGEQVVSDWTCTSPAFPAPVKGRDRCWVRGGSIARLEVELLAGPT